MHELGMAQEIVAMVSERAGGSRVTRVVLEVGKLAAVLPDALRFCFDLCVEGTRSIEGAAWRSSKPQAGPVVERAEET